MDNLDPLVPEEILELLDLQDHVDHLACLAQVDQLELLGNEVKQGHLVMLDLLDSQVQLDQLVP